MGALALNKVGKSASSFLDLLRGDATNSSSATTSATAGDASGNAATSIQTLQQQSQTLLDQFKRTLQQRLSAAGIDTSQPVHLAEDSLGDVVVDTSHPDYARIEQIFHDDPTFAAQFRQLHTAYAQLQQAGVSLPTTSEEEHVERGRTFAVTLSGNQINVDFVG